MADPQGFEEQLEALERIVEELEGGELSLDDSMARFADGVKRLRACTEMLDKAEEQVTILVKGARGDLVEEPFGADES